MYKKFSSRRIVVAEKIRVWERLSVKNSPYGKSMRLKFWLMGKLVGENFGECKNWSAKKIEYEEG
jgi:hypothetical protein